MTFYITKDGGIWHLCSNNSVRSYYKYDGACGKGLCNIKIPTMLLIASDRKFENHCSSFMNKLFYTSFHAYFSSFVFLEELETLSKIEL